jgi:hypothetical protein
MYGTYGTYQTDQNLLMVEYPPPPHGSTAVGGRGFLIVEVLMSVLLTDTPHSVGLLWTSDRLVAEATTWQHTTLARDKSMPSAGFELAILASARPQTYALDHEASGNGGIGCCSCYCCCRHQLRIKVMIRRERLCEELEQVFDPRREHYVTVFVWRL